MRVGNAWAGREQQPCRRSDGDRARVGSPPAEGIEEQRHDRERRAPSCGGEPAVEPLRERRAAARPDVVAAADERERRAHAHRKARRERERRVGRDQRRGVARGQHREPCGADACGTEAVAESSRRQLHEHVGEEEHRREQADDGQPDPVRAPQLVGDGADVGDVPTGREADGAPADDGSRTHGRCEPGMMTAMAGRSTIRGLY